MDWILLQLLFGTISCKMGSPAIACVITLADSISTDIRCDTLLGTWVGHVDPFFVVCVDSLSLRWRLCAPHSYTPNNRNIVKVIHQPPTFSYKLYAWIVSTSAMRYYLPVMHHLKAGVKGCQLLLQVQNCRIMDRFN